MSTRGPGDAEPVPGADETFLSRWSRRKAQAQAQAQTQARAEPREPDPAATPAAVPLPAAAPTTGAPAGAVTEAGLPPEAPLAEVPAAPAVELPDIDALGEDSDYSAFLTPGVDADVRRRALRKLFASPKFNVFDGLDTYRDDYTEFPALGAVVTADMRYHVERLARKVVEVLDEQTAPVASAATATATASDAAEPASVPTESQVEPDAPAGPEENHDSPA